VLCLLILKNMAMLATSKTTSNYFSKALISSSKSHTCNWKTSDLQQADFCKQHGLYYHTINKIYSKFLLSEPQQVNNVPLMLYCLPSEPIHPRITNE